MLLISQYDGPQRFTHQQPPDQDTLPHTSQSGAPPAAAVGSSSQQPRSYIEPDGHTLYPHGPPSHLVTEIIRSNFFGVYVSWKKIPQEVRDMWFHEFERAFHWLPQHQHTIRTNFDNAGSKRLRDLFTEVRKIGDKPDWIGEGIWASLNKEWGTPAYKKKCAQNKQNRASDHGSVGISLSTGGSVPLTEHRRRLEKELGREPTMSELHVRTHQKKNKQWVDERARIVNEEYMCLKEQHSQASLGDESSSASSHMPSDFDIWSQAVGGKNRGRTCGLGAQGPAFEARSSTYTTFSDCSYTNIQDMYKAQ